MAGLADILNPAALGVSVLGNIAGGIATANLAKKQQADLNTEKAKNETEFNKDYYQNQLNTSQNQAYLRALQDRLKEQSLRSQRTAAITGATPEAQASTTKGIASSYGEAINKLSAGAQQRKDRARTMYDQRRNQLFGMQQNIDAQKTNSWKQLMGNASGLGVGALSNFSTPKTNVTPPVVAPVIPEE